MDDKWLYNLKKRSENFERKVHDGLWEGIEQALGKQQDVVCQLDCRKNVRKNAGQKNGKHGKKREIFPDI